MIRYLQSRNTNLQFEVAAIIYRLMWREREYKFLPQYLDEKYTQNYIWKIPNGKRRLDWFMCMWEDDT